MRCGVITLAIIELDPGKVRGSEKNRVAKKCVCQNVGPTECGADRMWGRLDHLNDVNLKWTSRTVSMLSIASNRVAHVCVTVIIKHNSVTITC